MSTPTRPNHDKHLGVGVVGVSTDGSIEVVSERKKKKKKKKERKREKEKKRLQRSNLLTQPSEAVLADQTRRRLSHRARDMIPSCCWNVIILLLSRITQMATACWTEFGPPGYDVPTRAKPGRALAGLHRFGIGCTVWFGIRTGRAGPPIGQCHPAA